MTDVSATVGNVMCSVTSLSIGFLALHLPAALLLGPMTRGSSSVCAESLCNFPAPLFRCPSHSWLHDCTKPHWFDSHTLAVNWPIVLAILLVTLLSTPSWVGYWCAIAHCLEIPGPGFFSWRRGGNGHNGARLRRSIRLVAFMQYLRVLFVAGAAVWSPA